MEEQQSTASRIRKIKSLKKFLFFLMVGCLLCASGVWWVHKNTHIETDNAFVEAPIHSIAPRIAGSVIQVLVTDNQHVHQGDPLVVLDDRDAKAALDTAVAELAVAHNTTNGNRAQVERSRADVIRAQAQAQKAGLDLKRAEILFQQKVMPKEQLDRARTAQIVATAQVREAEKKLQQDIATVGAPVGSAPAALVAKREAELETAKLRLSYTRLYAPVDGYVTRKSVETGNWVQPGQALMAVVNSDEPWITANYKESQLTDVRPGMQVHFSVDTYPGHTFTGRVQSIMAGTGAAFSLLPPENATGNYVKVTQRIPVKISIDPVDQHEYPLRVGMSVVPVILVDNPFSHFLGFSPGPLRLVTKLIWGEDVFSAQK